MKSKSVNNEEVYNKKEKDKLQYKQLILIILFTVIMIVASLLLSFSVVNMMGGHDHDDGFNTIIIPIKPTPPGDDDKPGKDDDDDDDHGTGIVFNYKEKDTVGNGIEIYGMWPTADEVGREFKGDFYTFEFSLYFGNKSFNRYYEITAEKLDITTLPDKYAKVYLEVDDQAVPSVLRKDGSVKVFSDYENATVNRHNLNEKILYSGRINKRDISMGSKRFVLKMWLSEDTPYNDETTDKTFAVRINVYAK